MLGVIIGLEPGEVDWQSRKQNQRAPYFFLGDALHKDAQYDYALLHYLVARRHDRADLNTYYRLGLTFAALGHKEEAIASFDRVISETSENSTLRLKSELERVKLGP